MNDNDAGYLYRAIRANATNRRRIFVGYLRLTSDIFWRIRIRWDWTTFVVLWPDEIEPPHGWEGRLMERARREGLFNKRNGS